MSALKNNNFVCCYMLETHWSESQENLEPFRELQNILIILQVLTAHSLSFDCKSETVL